jgi:hypothetical protein
VFEIDKSSDIWIYNLCTKAIREMVSPVKDVATMAADNKNGFLSSILAWVRNGTIGQRDYYGFVLYNATEDTKYLDDVSEVCKTALTETIKCDPYVEKFRELRYRGSLESKSLTDSVCDVGCGKSLKSWFDTVTTSCANFQVGGAIANRAGGIVWTGYNETCLLDPATGQYCNGKCPLPFPNHHTAHKSARHAFRVYPKRRHQGHASKRTLFLLPCRKDAHHEVDGLFDV